MEIALASGALAALVWLTVMLRQSGLWGAALLMLASCVALGHPFFNIPMSPLPLTLDRGLLAVLVMTYCGLRWRDGLTARPVEKVDVLAVAFVGLILVSTLTHDWKFANSKPLSHCILFYLFPLLGYWVVRSLPLDERAGRRVIFATAAFGVYLAINACCEVLMGGQGVFPGYIASRDSFEFMGRARGPVMNPAGNGVLLGGGLSAALLCWPWVNRFAKLGLMLGLLPLFGLGLYCTLTRSAWIGGGLALAVVVGWSLPKRSRIALVGMATIACCVGVTLKWDSLMTYKRDKDLDAELTAESAKLRPTLALAAWHMFLDEPLMGHGFGQYSRACLPFLADRSSELPLEKIRPFIQHNVWLATLVDTGLPGLTLLVLLMGYWLRDAGRLWCDRSLPLWQRQQGLLFLGHFASYWPNAMFHDCSLMPSLNMVLFFYAGVLRSATQVSTPAPATRELDCFPWTGGLVQPFPSAAITR